jgi:hypothetical protein
MSLQDAAQRVAKEFDYPDDEVLKGGKHFITQMRMSPTSCTPADPGLMRIQRRAC